MRIDLGMVLAIIFEYIIFIYYADTLFYRKRNKYLCYAIIALVYIADFWLGRLEIWPVLIVIYTIFRKTKKQTAKKYKLV